MSHKLSLGQFTDTKYMYARHHFSQRHSTPHLLITVPLHSPIPSGSTHWVQARVFPQSTSYHSPVVSRVCLVNPSSQTGERVGTKMCVSVCYTISASKWFLRGGEGALRDGRDDLFCFPPFPLLTTSWRCLVNFLHWKGRSTPTPHFHIANSSSPPATLPYHNPCSHASLPTLTPRALFAQQTFDHFGLPFHQISSE